MGFQSNAFQSSAFQIAIAAIVAVKTGTGGIDVKRKRNVIKPTGLLFNKKVKKEAEVRQAIEEVKEVVKQEILAVLPVEQVVVEPKVISDPLANLVPGLQTVTGKTSPLDLNQSIAIELSSRLIQEENSAYEEAIYTLTKDFFDRMDGELEIMLQNINQYNDNNVLQGMIDSDEINEAYQNLFDSVQEDYESIIIHVKSIVDSLKHKSVKLIKRKGQTVAIKVH